MILCDTNILIEFYKGNKDVTDNLRGIGLSNVAVSVITVGELFFGARDRRELLKIKKHLSGLYQVMLDPETSQICILLLESYALSHRLNLPDSLIAASALRHNIALYTLNIKDFHFVEGLALYKP